MIRYRDTSHGVTQISVKALKHIERLGKIFYVRGYGGSGPHGLKQLLQKINVERFLVDKVLNIPWTTSNEIRNLASDFRTKRNY